MITEKQTLKLSILDIHIIFSIWGRKRMERKDISMAVEVTNAIEPYLAKYQDRFNNIANSNMSIEQREDIAKDLNDAVIDLVLSPEAVASLYDAFAAHDGWTMRGAKQAARIEDAFKAAME